MNLIVMMMAVLLAGCAGSMKSADAARFDFGPLEGAGPALPLSGVKAGAPSWLDTPAMQYRLAHADPSQRRQYAENRWAAPPAELLERALGRRLAAGDASQPGCRLRVELDELIQVFDSPQASRVVLEARAALLPPRGEAPVARKSFTLSLPASSADARGGVAAASAAVRKFGDDLAAWIAPLASRCHGEKQ